MKTNRIAHIAILGLLLTVFETVSSPAAGASPAVTSEVVASINGERAARGLSPLAVDHGASAAGAANAYLATGQPHPAGHDWATSGDQIAKEVSLSQHGTSGQAVRLWMGSDPHRKVILDPAATRIRVGVACRDDGRMFAVAQVLTTFGAGGSTPAATPVTSSTGGSKCPTAPAVPSTPVPPASVGPPAAASPGAQAPHPGAGFNNQCFTAALYERVIGVQPTAAQIASGNGLIRDLGRAGAAVRTAESDGSLNRMVNDVYRATLERGSDSGGLAYWRGELRRSRSVTGVMASVFSSPESYGRGGGTDEGYVRRLYRLVLNRQSDSGGLAYWTGQVRSKGRHSVAHSMLGSDELRIRRVDATHLQIIGSKPDAAQRAVGLWVLAVDGEVGLISHLVTTNEFYASTQSPSCIASAR